MSDEAEYEVGYKKPPKRSQFKPGESGNRKGRPKRETNVGSAIVRELAVKISVRENNVTKKLTKAQAMAKNVVQKAMSGDMKAVSQLVKLMPKQFEVPASAEQGASAAEISSAEKEVLERFVARRLQLMNTTATAKKGDENE